MSGIFPIDLSNKVDKDHENEVLSDKDTEAMSLSGDAPTGAPKSKHHDNDDTVTGASSEKKKGCMKKLLLPLICFSLGILSGYFILSLTHYKIGKPYKKNVLIKLDPNYSITHTLNCVASQKCKGESFTVLDGYSVMLICDQEEHLITLDDMDNCENDADDEYYYAAPIQEEASSGDHDSGRELSGSYGTFCGIYQTWRWLMMKEFNIYLENGPGDASGVGVGSGPCDRKESTKLGEYIVAKKETTALALTKSCDFSYEYNFHKVSKNKIEWQFERGHYTGWGLIPFELNGCNNYKDISGATYIRGFDISTFQVSCQFRMWKSSPGMSTISATRK